MKLRLILLVSFSVFVLVAIAPEVQAKAGTPITTCGQTVTTNAVLMQDLYCPGASGVVVGASGITIDLNGFTLRGDRTASTYGIDDSGAYDKVTVKNGVLRNFDDGVYGDFGADGLVVLSVVASGNLEAGISIGGASASITRSTASGNVFGIFVSGPSASIASSVAAGNAENGIGANGASAHVKSSSAMGNGLSGITVDGASATIASSTASGNLAEGIVVNGGSAKIKSASTTGNSGDGIDVGGASANISSTTASGNGVYGIDVDGDVAQVNSNRTEANGFANGVSDGHGFGIQVFNFTTAPTGTNVARGNDDPTECSPASLCPTNH